MILEQIMSSH